MICGHPRKIVKTDPTQNNTQQLSNQQSSQQGLNTTNQNIQKINK